MNKSSIIKTKDFRINQIGSKIRQIITRSNTWIEVISSLLIVLWIYTGLNKLIDYDDFKFQLGRSPFLQNLSDFIAVTLPVGELLIVLTLIIKRTRLLGFYLSFLLMVLFTGYVYAMLNYSYYLPCSCGGVLAALSWQDHLIFNIMYTLLALTGIILQSKMNAQLKKSIVKLI